MSCSSSFLCSAAMAAGGRGGWMGGWVVVDCDRDSGKVEEIRRRRFSMEPAPAPHGW